MPEPVSLSDTVNGWFRDRIAHGAVARDTEAYNQIAEALPELIERLASIVAASAPADLASAPDPAPLPPPSK